MTDIEKIRKILNLTSSPDDAEALAALRMAQKLCGNLGDYLPVELSQAEINKIEDLSQRLEKSDKSLRKSQRDLQTLKGRISDYQETIEKLEKQLQDAPAKSNLQELYEREVDKNEELRERLAEREKGLMKAQRDNIKLKRDRKSPQSSHFR